MLPFIFSHIFFKLYYATKHRCTVKEHKYMPKILQRVFILAKPKLHPAQFLAEIRLVYTAVTQEVPSHVYIGVQIQYTCRLSCAPQNIHQMEAIRIPQENHCVRAKPHNMELLGNDSLTFLSLNASGYPSFQLSPGRCLSLKLL